MTRVLVTGGSGFVAGHVIDVLLKRGHSVIATVRSEDKAKAIRATYEDAPQGSLDFIVVPDIAVSGAFHELGSLGLEAVIHVASPLASTGARKTYTEADWSPITLKDAYANGLNAYIASKVLAEQSAWGFVGKKKPSFTLSTINPPMIYGPVRLPVKSLNSVNTSNQLLAEVLTGKHKAGLPPTALPLWVDVRDVALAHVKAMEREEAAGKRFFIAAGFYSNAEMGRAIWDNFPDLRDRLPDRNEMGGVPNQNLQSFGYDTSEAEKILDIEWTPYEKTVVDSVKSLTGRK
ncbi:hypothetical protein G7Z17_g537 [Cylindrodendrum hubeiense]|uniref:NAD-dependent epimerase/dehydratase domain-containing protein n=1 Tax=Cylindrodendrum hubeiense TaxID=595255 RepID=A0A9P5LMY1_9HYPO|nr:hypothetical protein G7Z17_g537 [Cylindrodendrum hubeiense]